MCEKLKNEKKNFPSGNVLEAVVHEQKGEMGSRDQAGVEDQQVTKVTLPKPPPPKPELKSPLMKKPPPPPPKPELKPPPMSLPKPPMKPPLKKLKLPTKPPPKPPVMKEQENIQGSC